MLISFNFDTAVPVDCSAYLFLLRDDLPQRLFPLLLLRRSTDLSAAISSSLAAYEVTAVADCDESQKIHGEAMYTAPDSAG